MINGIDDYLAFTKTCENNDISLEYKIYFFIGSI